MKFKYLLLLFIVFFLGMFGVKAADSTLISAADIPNSTYVIGNYMFTRNQSSNYQGQLTTQLIMVASPSINSKSVDDMIIYYKNARGNWVNALTGESLVVDTFYIYNRDTVPVLTIDDFDMELYDYYDVNGSEVSFMGVSFGGLKLADGIAIYSSSSENGTYTLIDNNGFFERDFINVKSSEVIERFTKNGMLSLAFSQELMPRFETRYFKARLFVRDGSDIVYGPWSPVYVSEGNTLTIGVSRVDEYSPDRVISVYLNGDPYNFKSIKYLDGTTLCTSSNPTVTASEIEGISSLIVVLNDDTEVVVDVLI